MRSRTSFLDGLDRDRDHDSGQDRSRLRSFAPRRPYVCLGCGAPMLENGCKIRCRMCGYFEDCGGGLTPPPVDSRTDSEN